LRNVYFPPFEAAVKAGVGTFMSAYMDLNDVPASGNRFLLRDVLRGEWGFKGFVVSDALAIGSLVTQGFARDGRDAAFRALSAGVDMDMTSNTYPQHLAGLVKDGTLKLADIEDGHWEKGQSLQRTAHADVVGRSGAFCVELLSREGRVLLDAHSWKKMVSVD